MEKFMAKWMVTMKKSDFDATAAKFGIKNITARLLTNRGVISDEDVEKYLRGDASMLYDPHLLADVEKGAGIIKEEIEKGSAIRVIGDYDVDGICSSYILVSGLRLLGADVDYVLPDRVKDGYGLSEKLVDEAKSDGREVIITCDNGIAASEQIAHAKELGMTVVVTDHHEVPFEADETDPENSRQILPPADAVIDPKRNDDESSFKEICGAVVAYKFLQVLAGSMGRSEDQNVRDFFGEMLVFAGLATVCDVMELRDENRIIVKESLKRVATTSNKGLMALINVNGLDARNISAYHYGFIIGPCLNATGRLDLASRALDLFLEEDENEAARTAQDLKEMNDSRKTMTQQGVDKASEIIDSETEQTGLPKVIVVFLPDAHESIAGIVAGRIKEKYYRPTIVLTKASDGGVKGSARSIEKYDMFMKLSEVKDLFTKFGGHKMAAGLSLPADKVDELKQRLNENCNLKDEDFVPVLKIDMVMPLRYADEQLIREFELLEPFGNGNTKPVFAQREVTLLSGKIMGKNKNCFKYRVTDESGVIRDMVYFGDPQRWHEYLTDKYGSESLDRLYNNTSDGNMKVSIAYYPNINSYMGRESVQIVMNDFT
jgi:single-stranded-DNA-specific exonuclease